MAKTLLSISESSLRQQPFFVLEGPDGKRLPCEWATFVQGRASGTQFEILTPLSGDRAGRLYGCFEHGEFRLHPSFQAHRAMKSIPVDLDWRGDLNCVLDTGHDWCVGENGFEICDPAEDGELLEAYLDGRMAQAA